MTSYPPPKPDHRVTGSVLSEGLSGRSRIQNGLQQIQYLDEEGVDASLGWCPRVHDSLENGLTWV